MAFEHFFVFKTLEHAEPFPCAAAFMIKALEHPFQQHCQQNISSSHVAASVTVGGAAFCIGNPECVCVGAFDRMSHGFAFRACSHLALRALNF